ncbi:hypothetical protein FRC12_000445 [Ceratobasidium sp. 428]|nr:hypothetical protein FRC12_000445 [Ceratobasidium sp. 428]
MPPPAVFLKSQRWLRQCRDLSKSASDTSDVEDCLQRLESPIIQDPFKDLSVTDLYILASKRWLFDKHINACGAYINSHAANSSHFVVDSFFVSALRKARTKNPSWSPRQATPPDKAAASGSIRFLLIPIHTLGHWTFLLLDLKEDSYVYVDSLDLDRLPPEDLIPLLDWWLSSVRHKICTLMPSPRTFQAEQQNDYHSCGPFVMSTMSHIALSTLPWTLSQSHMHRIQWFLTFTTKPVMPQLAILPPTAPSLNSLPGAFSRIIDYDPAGSDLSGTETTSDNEDPSCYGAPSTPSTPSTPHTPAKPRPIAPLPSYKQYKQTQLGFAPISREKWLLQEKHRSLKTKEINVSLREKEEAATLQKKLDKKEKERLKKHAQRARKRAKLQESEPVIEPAVAAHESDGWEQATYSPLHLSAGVAELSLPHRYSKHVLNHPDLQGSGHAYENEEKKARRVNWMKSSLFAMIDKAAREVGFSWSPVAIVKRLRLRHPEIFGRLSPQRISDWRDKSVTDRLKWKDKVIAAVRHGTQATFN